MVALYPFSCVRPELGRDGRPGEHPAMAGEDGAPEFLFRHPAVSTFGKIGRNLTNQKLVNRIDTFQFFCCESILIRSNSIPTLA